MPAPHPRRRPGRNDRTLRHRKNCDQIVIGPRGLGGTKELLMGSVANKLMQLSTLPVLLIK
ncbi:MAG: universal stress protein [Nitrosomonadaceae bacterium]|nr:universal stress protein [Nitrosomonadaceae bacterium]